MQTLTHSKDLTNYRIRILTASLLCHWWIFSSVHPTIGCMQEKSAKIYMSQAAIGTIFRTTGCYRNYFQDHRLLSELRVAIGTIFRTSGGYRNYFQEPSWLSKLFSGPQAASGTTFRSHRRLSLCRNKKLSEVWTVVTEMILELVTVFIEASQNFRHDFLNNKAGKKFKNHQRITFRKYWVDL